MTEHERRELEPHPAALPLRRGASGEIVRRVQEWLTLHDYGTAIDGDFGPATEECVRRFQQHEEAEHDGPGARTYGEVNQATWHGLIKPMRHAISWHPLSTFSVAQNVIYCAEAHLLNTPREVGGPNSGPWVRLYMDGHEGEDWPWCAGFTTYVLRQALGHDMWRTFSCDELAHNAKDRAAFISAEHPNLRYTVKPGNLFLLRSPGLSMVDWIHCGIVTAVGPDYFETVEGNTNQGGSREGTEVCKRVRAFNNRTDFVLMGEVA